MSGAIPLDNGVSIYKEVMSWLTKSRMIASLAVHVLANAQ